MTLEIQAVTYRKELQYPIMLRQMTDEEFKAYHRKRLEKLFKKSAEQIPQQQSRNQEQKKWIKRKMNQPTECWKRWDGIVEEWTPWGMFGDPINIWRAWHP
jgi:hypothetical protein